MFNTLVADLDMAVTERLAPLFRELKNGNNSAVWPCVPIVFENGKAFAMMRERRRIPCTDLSLACWKAKGAENFDPMIVPAFLANEIARDPNLRIFTMPDKAAEESPVHAELEWLWHMMAE